MSQPESPRDVYFKNNKPKEKKLDPLTERNQRIFAQRSVGVSQTHESNEEQHPFVLRNQQVMIEREGGVPQSHPVSERSQLDELAELNRRADKVGRISLAMSFEEFMGKVEQIRHKGLKAFLFTMLITGILVFARDHGVEPAVVADADFHRPYTIQEVIACFNPMAYDSEGECHPIAAVEEPTQRPPVR